MMNNYTMPHTMFRVELEPVHAFFFVMHVYLFWKESTSGYLTSFHPNGQTCPISSNLLCVDSHC